MRFIKEVDRVDEVDKMHKMDMTSFPHQFIHSILSIKGLN